MKISMIFSFFEIVDREVNLTRGKNVTMVPVIKC